MKTLECWLWCRKKIFKNLYRFGLYSYYVWGVRSTPLAHSQNFEERSLISPSQPVLSKQLDSQRMDFRKILSLVKTGHKYQGIYMKAKRLLWHYPAHFSLEREKCRIQLVELKTHFTLNKLLPKITSFALWK